MQLAVTMDYSIFLWHSYQEQIDRYDGDKKRAMAPVSYTHLDVYKRQHIYSCMDNLDATDIHYDKKC